MEQNQPYTGGVHRLGAGFPLELNVRQVAGNALQEQTIRRIAAELSASVVLTPTGAPATAYLLSAPEHGASHGARLVIVDLLEPGRYTCSLLGSLRGSIPTYSAPVVVFYPADRVIPAMGGEGWGANSWIPKSGEPDRLMATVRSVCTYWLSLNEMPAL